MWPFKSAREHTMNSYYDYERKRMSEALKIQMGGDHYKTMDIQPIEALKIWLTPEEYQGFLRGNIIKYQARANSGKGTREENLAKAAHYQQFLTEFLDERKSQETVKQYTHVINTRTNNS